MKLSIYFVGYTKDEAKKSLPFSSYDSAEEYASDHPGMKVFIADALVLWTTMERAT